MNNKRLNSLLTISVTIVFILSLFSTAHVLADDSTPPAPTEEPALPPTAEDSADAEEPASTSTPEAETPAEVLASAPEGVDVVVLDENGQPLPLVTEEAAQIILAGDPMWCPDSVLPGGAGCTPAYPNDFAGLVADLTDGGYSGSGTIYVAYDYSAAEGQIYINHTSGNLADLDDLTIQGGWDLNPLSVTYNTLVGNSTLDGTWLAIENWIGDVAVNNIFIDNADSVGLFVETEGDVTLNYVGVNNSDLAGAYIVSGGDVAVTNSDFTDNGDEGYFDEVDHYEAAPGLFVDAAGNVTLNNVYAAHNGGDGAYLVGTDIEITESLFEYNGWGQDDGHGAYWEYDEYDADDDDDIDDVHTYSENIHGGNGLTVHSYGDLTINDIAANGNAGNGAELDSEGNITITDSTFGYTGIGGGNGGIGSFYITDYFANDGDQYYNSFYLNYGAGSGLIADADGTITLTDVSAGGNAHDGAELYANHGDVIISDSVFLENGSGTGLFDSEDGYILLEDYMIDFCNEIGSYNSFVFNPCLDYSYVDVQAPNFHFEVNVYDDGSVVSGNNYYITQSGGSGLDAESEDGSVTLDGVVVLENGGDGAYLNGHDGVTVTDSLFALNGDVGYLGIEEGFYDSPEYSSVGAGVDFSYGDGLRIRSSGDVTLNQVGAYANGFHGVYVDSNSSLFVEQSEFISNGYPVYLGGEGGLFGGFLCDEIGLCDELELPVSGFGLGILFYEDEAGTGFGVNLGFGSGSGLSANVGGDITLMEVLAADNLGFGADLFSSSNIAVTDSEYYANGAGFFGILFLSVSDESLEFGAGITNGSGLSAYAENDVTLSGVVANGNVLHGAELYSDAVNSVFVEDSEFNGNGYGGFLGNGGWFEVYHYEDLDEYIDEFDGGSGSGLHIHSSGNVTLIDVDANGNYQDGAEVYSQGGRVIVSCGHYDGNGEYGIYEDGASSLELYGPEILGNGYSPDEYFFSGSLILSEDCTIPSPPPPSTAHEGDGGSCAGNESRTFIMPNGDYVTFPCPLKDYAVVSPLGEAALPSPLGGGLSFVSALHTEVFRNDKPVEKLAKAAAVSFVIPEGVDVESLTILFWNGSEWVDLGGSVSEDGLYFAVSTNLVGTFVLASK